MLSLLREVISSKTAAAASFIAHGIFPSTQTPLDPAEAEELLQPLPEAATPTTPPILPMLGGAQGHAAALSPPMLGGTQRREVAALPVCSRSSTPSSLQTQSERGPGGRSRPCITRGRPHDEPSGGGGRGGSVDLAEEQEEKLDDQASRGEGSRSAAAVGS
jgi:hypothetical protein